MQHSPAIPETLGLSPRNELVLLAHQFTRMDPAGPEISDRVRKNIRKRVHSLVGTIEVRKSPIYLFNQSETESSDAGVRQMKGLAVRET